jgi:hypothetical protein
VIDTPLRQKVRLATQHRSERVRRNPLQFEPIALLVDYRNALFARFEMLFPKNMKAPNFVAVTRSITSMGVRIAALHILNGQ